MPRTSRLRPIMPHHTLPSLPALHASTRTPTGLPFPGRCRYGEVVVGCSASSPAFPNLPSELGSSQTNGRRAPCDPNPQIFCMHVRLLLVTHLCTRRRPSVSHLWTVRRMVSVRAFIHSVNTRRRRQTCTPSCTSAFCL